MAVLGESFDMMLITEPCCHFPGPYPHIHSYYYGDGAASGIRSSGLCFHNHNFDTSYFDAPTVPCQTLMETIGFSPKPSDCADTQNYNYIFKRLKLTR